MDEELKEKIASWILDGDLTCLTCSKDDEGGYNCEEPNPPICDSLHSDLDKLDRILKESGYCKGRIGEPPIIDMCRCGSYDFQPFASNDHMIHCYECEAYRDGQIFQRDIDVQWYEKDST